MACSAALSHLACPKRPRRYRDNVLNANTLTPCELPIQTGVAWPAAWGGGGVT